MAKKTIMESVEEFVMGVTKPARKSKKSNAIKKKTAKKSAVKKNKAKKTKAKKAKKRNVSR